VRSERLERGARPGDAGVAVGRIGPLGDEQEVVPRLPVRERGRGRLGARRLPLEGLDDQRAQEAKPIPASRPARLKEAKRRLEEELFTECQANAAYEAYRARGAEAPGQDPVSGEPGNLPSISQGLDGNPGCGRRGFAYQTALRYL